MGGRRHAVVTPNRGKPKGKEEDITKDNYLEKQSEWEPHLRRDMSALTTCIFKYNVVMEESVGEIMIHNLTSSTLTFNVWLRDLKRQDLFLHSTLIIMFNLILEEP